MEEILTYNNKQFQLELSLLIGVFLSWKYSKLDTICRSWDMAGWRKWCFRKWLYCGSPNSYLKARAKELQHTQICKINLKYH